MKLGLGSNKGFTWFHEGSVWAKGYLFDARGTYYSDAKLTTYFARVDTQEALRDKLRGANGSFAVVIHSPQLKAAAVDRLRSIPLFYTVENSELYIADDAHRLLEHVRQKSIDELSRSEFLRTGYVLGANTLVPGIKQLQAGEVMVLQNSNVLTEFYYRHLRSSDLQLSEAEHFERLESISNNVFGRLISSAQGKTLLIPLSGGYDSRYIAALLKRLGYENVICYTYGRKDSFEVVTSKKVAEMLGYPWHFIEYTPQLWENYAKSSKVEAYHHYASNLSSLPHIQDFIALEHLQKHDLLPQNAIFVPGFCGDLLGGSYVPAELYDTVSREDLLIGGITKYIYERHFNLLNAVPAKLIPRMQAHITQTLMSTQIKTVDEFISFNEAWFTEHKVAKFIVNALRPYEFFGYSWRMPLWDSELFEYWYRVPNERRRESELYNRYLLNYVFAPLDIAFEKNHSGVVKGPKMFVKKRLPKPLFTALKNTYWRFRRKAPTRDINAFTHLADLYYDELRQRGKPVPVSDNVNQPLAAWFLASLSLESTKERS